MNSMGKSMSPESKMRISDYEKSMETNYKMCAIIIKFFLIFSIIHMFLVSIDQV